MLDRGLAQRPTSQHLEVKLACMVCDLTCKDRSINKPIYLSGLGALCRVRPTGEHQSVKHRCMVQDGVGLEQSPRIQAQQINLGYMVQDLREAYNPSSASRCWVDYVGLEKGSTSKNDDFYALAFDTRKLHWVKTAYCSVFARPWSLTYEMHNRLIALFFIHKPQPGEFS